MAHSFKKVMNWIDKHRANYPMNMTSTYLEGMLYDYGNDLVDNLIDYHKFKKKFYKECIDYLPDKVVINKTPSQLFEWLEDFLKTETKIEDE